MNLFDSFDIAMLAAALLALVWGRSLRRQNAALYARTRKCARSTGSGKRQSFVVVVEHDLGTGMLMGSVPGIRGAHSQAKSIEGLRSRMREVLQLLDQEGHLQVAQSQALGVLVVDLAEGAE